MLLRRKRLLAMLLATLLCLIFGGMVNAAEGGTQIPITPYWVNTNYVSVNLSFDGGVGTCGATVIGKSGTSQITGTVELARKNSNGTYTPIKTWSGLKAEDSKLVFKELYYVSTGDTYRLTMTATVYLNGIGETVSSYHEAYAS